MNRRKQQQDSLRVRKHSPNKDGGNEHSRQRNDTRKGPGVAGNRVVLYHSAEVGEAGEH